MGPFTRLLQPPVPNVAQAHIPALLLRYHAHFATSDFTAPASVPIPPRPACHARLLQRPGPLSAFNAYQGPFPAPVDVPNACLGLIPVADPLPHAQIAQQGRMELKSAETPLLRAFHAILEPWAPPPAFLRASSASQDPTPPLSMPVPRAQQEPIKASTGKVPAPSALPTPTPQLPQPAPSPAAAWRGTSAAIPSAYR